MRIILFGIACCAGLLSPAQFYFDAPMPIAANISDVERPYVVEVDGDVGTEIILGSTGLADVLVLDLLGGELDGARRLLQGEDMRIAFHAVDLNADGLADLVTGNSGHYPFFNPYCLSIYMNDGSGMFNDPICAFNGQAYNQFANADLVGDGAQELIGWRTDAVDIYAFDEPGNAMELVRSLLGYQAQTPFSADLTNDGRDELILRTWGEAIQVWDPTTGNSAPLITIGTNPLYLASTIRPADVDQDGWIDLVQLADSAGSNNGFIVWKNLGGLVFQRLPFVPLTPYIEDFVLEDTDGDGMTEVLFERNTFLLRAEFLPGVIFSAIDTLLIAPAGITSFAFVDIGMDGLRDLLVLRGDNHLCVASGTGDPMVFSTLDTVLSWTHSGVGAVLPVDPDGNGLQDLAVFSQGIATTLQVLEPDPLAWMEPEPAVEFESSHWTYHPQRLIATDLDGDGDEDIIGTQRATDPFQPQLLFALENTGGQYVLHPLGAAMMADAGTRRYLFDDLRLFDVNGDGLDDLVISGAWQELWGPQITNAQDYILLRTSPFMVEAGQGPLAADQYLKAHDMDQDGDLDVIELDQQAGVFVVYVNDGNGAFSVADPVPADLDLLRTQWTWADVDGDQIEEMVRWAVGPGLTTLYAQQTTGLTLAAPQVFFQPLPGDSVINYQFCDLDGDNDADLLITTELEQGSYIDILRMHINTNGTASSAGQVVHSGRWTRIAPFDMDGDGDLDLALNAHASLYVLKQQSGQVSIGEDESYLDRGVHAFPNPCEQMLTIDMGRPCNDDLYAELIDLSGRSIKRISLGTQRTLMNVATTQQGTYMLRIVDATGGSVIANEKLVIMRTP